MLDWELLVDPVGARGAANMSLDQGLLDAACRTGTAFLRLYRWSPPCLSFGRNEPAATRYDRAAIERLGIDVVRRPTGGRAVWHDAEVTYAVAGPLAPFGSLRDTYIAIHARLAVALQQLGVPASLAPRPKALSPLDAGACFASTVGGEVVVNGRKLVGSAQVRQGSAFLQHGSILLDGSQDVMSAVGRRPSAVSQHTTLTAELGRPVTFLEVVEVICRTWPDRLTSADLYRRSPTSPAALPAWRR